MRCPRLTNRQILLAVLALAVGLGLSAPAVRVAADRDDHAHHRPAQVARLRVPGWAGGAVSLETKFSVRLSVWTRSPFWPRYWRCLAGRPWRQVPVCELGSGFRGETCSYERPDPVTDRTEPAPIRKVL